MSKEIHGAFFDLVGTLIRSRQPIGEQYAAWARRHGASGASGVELGAAFRRAMGDAPAMAFPGSSLEATARAERQWWRALVESVVASCRLDSALSGARFDAFFDDLYHHFTTAEAWELYPDARPALTRLRDGGLIVGLITNYDTRVTAVVDAVGLAPLLDSVTIPALVGAAKPDAAIFAHALRRHDLEPAAAIYVGDEPGDDYAGAASAGMRAILLDREGRYEGTEYVRVGSLVDVSGR